MILLGKMNFRYVGNFHGADVWERRYKEHYICSYHWVTLSFIALYGGIQEQSGDVEAAVRLAITSPKLLLKSQQLEDQIQTNLLRGSYEAQTRLDANMRDMAIARNIASLRNHATTAHGGLGGDGKPPQTPGASGRRRFLRWFR